MKELVAPSEHETSYRVLSDVTRLLVSEPDLSRVLDAIAQGLSSLIPFDSLIVYEADHDLRVLRPVQVIDPYAKDIYLHVCRFGEGISGQVAVSRQAMLVNDLHLDPRGLQIDGTPDEEEENLLSVPMIARDQLKGVLNVYRTVPGRIFEEHELRLAERFGELAALALDNARLRARLETESVVDRLTGLYNHRHFQERLADELRRAHLSDMPVALVLIDIDQFQRVNDVEGHLAGDRVLEAVGSLTRGSVRPGDVVCRVGGEEFAVVMPATSAEDAAVAAETIRARIGESLSLPAVPITASVGVAEGPAHGADARELMASANYALLQAKTSGRDRVSVYQAGEWSGVRAVPMGEARMVGHLKLLQSVSSKLNRLQNVRGVADTIVHELGDLVEFHNCRIHLMDPTGTFLESVAFHGTLSECEGEEQEEVGVIPLGEGINGRAALTGEPFYAPDASSSELIERVPGVTPVDESILVVPLKFDERVIGTIVLSKLGLNQFDADDLRLLESLASSAAVAFQNARLIEEERQSAETANALLRVSQALTRTRDPELVLHEVVGSMSDLLDVPKVTAWVRDPAGGYVPRAFVGFHPSELPRARVLRVDPETASRYMVSTEEPFQIPAEALEDIPDEMRLVPGGGPMVVAPFRWEPEGFGALVAIATDRSRTFTDRDVRVARGVADLASLAMGNAARFADLEHAFLQTVEVLANALEAKDEYTSGHAREVAEIAVTVGREIGVGEDDLRMLELAGMFHDIGKIGVGTEIINKPGPLTDEEMKEMQRHPEIGARILAPVEFLQPVLPIIRSGHERWDGKGYPDGLAGEDIPLGARVIFVCDAYHAMTSDRSYRKALPEEEAIRRLEEAAGTQFDPNVVAAFVDAHRRGMFQH